MKERPLLYSAPMVRATLEDRKTNTRRDIARLMGFGVITEFGVSDTPGYDWHFRDSKMRWHDISHERLLECCPYGQPGDRLWVRENGWERPERTPTMMREGADTWAPYYYDADEISDQESKDFKQWGFKRRPSIHMPRWASRLALEVISVRVERLQDISEEDAKAEGANEYLHSCHPSMESRRHVMGFQNLWESINGPGSWDANPWVWVLEFKQVK